jgi:hypothetical protein
MFAKLVINFHKTVAEKIIIIHNNNRVALYFKKFGHGTRK